MYDEVLGDTRSTIAPGRLFNVTNAGSFVALSQQNWTIASKELFRRVPTYQNGSLNTLNATPTAQRANANQAAATDLASFITLANELRAALVEMRGIKGAV